MTVQSLLTSLLARGAELFLLLMWFGKMEKRWNHFLPNALGNVALLLVCVFFQSVQIKWFNNYDLYYIIKLLFQFGFIILVNKEKPVYLAYYLTIFFLITDCLQKAFRYVMMRYMGTDFMVTGDFLKGQIPCQLIFIIIAGAFLWLAKMAIGDILQNSITIRSLVLSFFAILPYLYIRDINLWIPVDDKDLNPDIPIVMTLACVCALLVVIGNQKLVSYYVRKKDMAEMEMVLKTQQEQFRLKKEAVDMINRKYHDMKHYLSGLGGMDDITEIRNYIKELKKEVQPYEIICETGNASLDIICSEKLLICQKNGIACIPYIEGRYFSFMSPLDLSSIFGNAFDNAIEAVQKAEADGLKEISVKAVKKNEFVMIHFKNAYEQTPDISDGYYKTLKSNKLEHGFGLPNIKSIAEKYGGNVTIKSDDKHFSLTILIPLPSN